MRTTLLQLMAIATLSLLPACVPTAPPPAVAPTGTRVHVASAEAPSPVYRVPIDGLPTLGDANALVTIVVFTDYECPYCRKADALVQELRAHYGHDLRLVVAEHPMPENPNARPAALAALAAAEQGHFAGMHTRLYAGRLDEASIEQAANAEGLGVSRFNADRAGDAVAALDHAEQIAHELGVPGTPAFFINGRMVVGALPIATFEKVIDERLEAARKLVAAGTRPEDVYAKTIAKGLPHIVEAC